MIIHTDSVEFPALCPWNPSAPNFPFSGSVPPVISSLKTLWIKHRVFRLAPQDVTTALPWGEKTQAGTLIWQLSRSGDCQRHPHASGPRTPPSGKDTPPSEGSKSHSFYHVVPGSQGAPIQCKVGLHNPCPRGYAVITPRLQWLTWEGLCLSLGTQRHGSPAAQLCSLFPPHAGIQADGAAIGLYLPLSWQRQRATAKPHDGSPSVGLQVTLRHFCSDSNGQVWCQRGGDVHYALEKAHHRAKEGCIILLRLMRWIIGTNNTTYLSDNKVWGRVPQRSSST